MLHEMNTTSETFVKIVEDLVIRTVGGQSSSISIEPFNEDVHGHKDDCDIVVISTAEEMDELAEVIASAMQFSMTGEDNPFFRARRVGKGFSYDEQEIRTMFYLCHA